ncbi:MAG: tetratricopeptide repeat protein, partial [Alphaproteobacteria bacterium]
MTMTKTRRLLVGLVRLALWPAYPSAQGDLWETYMAAATKAYQQGNYPEAEKQLEAAVKEAEGFGPQDPRLATSLNNLAEVYRLEGRYGKAEPLHRRALAIR